ncbi:MAG: tetraacyldisaccharide 4'-kinase, partial [Bryobacterales bacterium]|nr:tetraacyldisaccharide 4'-kinase [Bryobacterales bacterium]
NPAAFHGTLHDLRIEPVFSWAFGDHHHYRAREIRRLAHQAQAAGARILLTTEKDLMNLPPDAAAHVKPLRIYWLRMRLEMEREEEFFEWLREICSRSEDMGYSRG